MAKRLNARSAAGAEPKPKKSKGKASPALASGDGVNDDVINQEIRECKEAKERSDKKKAEWKAEHQRFRSRIAMAGKRGVKSGVIKEGIELLEADPEELQQRIDQTNRLLLNLGIPVDAKQLGLFEDGETVGKKVDDARQAEVDELSAKEQKAAHDGYNCGERGVPDTKNPHADGTKCHDLWADNWGKAQAKKLRTIGRGNGKKPEAHVN
jgi:hypothetical protein